MWTAMKAVIRGVGVNWGILRKQFTQQIKKISSNSKTQRIRILSSNANLILKGGNMCEECLNKKHSTPKTKVLMA